MTYTEMIQTLRECREAALTHQNIIIANGAGVFYADVVEGLKITADKLRLVIEALEAEIE